MGYIDKSKCIARPYVKYGSRALDRDTLKRMADRLPEPDESEEIFYSMTFNKMSAHFYLNQTFRRDGVIFLQLPLENAYDDGKEGYYWTNGVYTHPFLMIDGELFVTPFELVEDLFKVTSFNFSDSPKAFKEEMRQVYEAQTTSHQKTPDLSSCISTVTQSGTTFYLWGIQGLVAEEGIRVEFSALLNLQDPILAPVRDGIANCAFNPLYRPRQLLIETIDESIEKRIKQTVLFYQALDPRRVRLGVRQYIDWDSREVYHVAADEYGNLAMRLVLTKEGQPLVIDTQALFIPTKTYVY